MLEDRDWLELLDYLLGRLVEMGATDFANEVRLAASSRVVESSTKAELGIPSSVYREVGNIVTRLPTPKEAVLQAVQALHTRLEMFPQVGEYLTKRLERRPTDIIWKLESPEYQTISVETSFSASDIVPSPEAREEISDILKHVVDLIQQA